MIQKNCSLKKVGAWRVKAHIMVHISMLYFVALKCPISWTILRIAADAAADAAAAAAAASKQ